MPRGKKRDANAIQVTVRPNTDGTSKKAKTSYSRKKVFTKVNKPGTTRTVQLVHCGNIDQALTRNAIAQTEFKANDIFTNQPMGRDQMFAMYDKCYVKSVSQDAYIGLPNCNHDGFHLLEFVINHWIDNNPSASASLEESSERCISRDGKHIVKAGVKYDSDYDQNYNIHDTVHSYVEASTKRILNRGYEDPDNAQTSSGGPTALYYIHLEMYARTLAGDVTATFHEVHIEKTTKYECLFFDPKDLAVST